MKKVIVFVSMALCLTSCMVNRHTVGDGPVGSTHFKKQLYDRGKRIYVLYGILSSDRPNLRIPKDGNYQFEACTNITDGIISSLFGGLISTRTEKIYVKSVKE